MRSQWLLLAIATKFFSISYAQTTSAPTAATTSESELDSILGVGLSFIRSVVSADPTTVTTTYSPSSTSSSSLTTTSASSTSSSTSSRPSSSSTTLASQTSSSTSSSATTSSSSTTPSTVAASAKPNDKGDPSNKNLAIILGSVLGSLALLSLIIFFCCLRRHRKKHPHDHIGYDHMEKNASSSRQSLSGKRNSTGANSRSRSLSETRSINQNYNAIPPVPPPHRLSKNDSSSYGAVPTSQRSSRQDPFHDRNVSTPGRYYDRSATPAHRTPPLPTRSPQRQSDYFPPYDAPRGSQGSSPHSSFGSAQTLGDTNNAGGAVGPSPPLQTQQKHRSLPRSSLANEFNFGFDSRDGSVGHGQDVPREFRRKSVASQGY